MAEKKSDIVRSVAGFLRGYVSDRRRVLRRGARFEAHLPFIISLLGTEQDSAAQSSPTGAPAVVGHTRDLSETGMTLLLPSVRIEGAYLTERGSYLGIQLELPDGPVAMLTVSVRFEQLSEKEDGCSYLLGVRVIRMQSKERERYAAYLGSLESSERRALERRQARTAAIINPNSAAQVSTWENLTPTSVSMAFEKFLRDQTRLRKS